MKNDYFSKESIPKLCYKIIVCYFFPNIWSGGSSYKSKMLSQTTLYFGSDHNFKITKMLQHLIRSNNSESCWSMVDGENK